MKVVILAAGKGTRLFPLTKDTPKSLIEISEGKTLLDKQVDAIRQCGITDIIIVSGYLSAQLEQKVQQLSQHPANRDLNLRVVYNPFYELSNNFMSLWFVRHEIEHDDVIVINGDNLFNHIVLQQLVDEKSGGGMCMVISKKDRYDEDDMKVTLQNDRVVAVSKKIPQDQAHGESVGMIKIHREGRLPFLAIVNEMARHPENLSVFWLQAIQNFMTANNGISYVEIPREYWFEMDFHQDLNLISHLLNLKYQHLAWLSGNEKR